jgi:rubrerythrin
MAVSFSADEIFEMAEEIERNGAKFYRKAAKGAGDSETKKFFEDMAAMEDEHEATFAAMRKDLSASEKEQTAFDPYDEAALYLQTMADSHGTEGRKSLDEELTGEETPVEVLKIACGAERDSIVFYTGLKSLVSAKGGRDRVDAIIKEEVGHLAKLRQRLIRA